MTTYYVRKGHGGNGLTPANAFGMLAAALQVVAAGDTVYIGAGWYGERFANLDLLGTADTPIVLIGDVTGWATGDAGPVIIGPTPTTLGADVGRVDHQTWRNLRHVHFVSLAFLGPNHSLNAPFVSDNTTILESVRFEGCAFASSHGSALAVDLTLVHPFTPPQAAGVVFESCLLAGRVRFLVEDVTIAATDLKSRFANCIFLGPSSEPAIYLAAPPAAELPFNGVEVTHCTFHGSWSWAELYGLAASPYRTTLANSWLLGGYRPYPVFSNDTATAAAASRGGNLFASSQLEDDIGWALGTDQTYVQPPLIGGLHDHLYYRHYGMSPYRFFEPITAGNAPIVASSDPAVSGSVSEDAYGLIRPAHGRRVWLPSYLGQTAYGVGWNNIAMIRNPTWTVYPSSNSVGSQTTNYMHVAGFYRQSLRAAHQVTAVKVRVHYVNQSSAVSGHARIYGGPGLTPVLAELPLPVAPVMGEWRAVEILLPEPEGGWSYAACSAVEVRLWKTGGTGTLGVRYVEVIAEATGGVTAGAVEGRVQPVPDASERFDNTESIRFDGPGYYEIFKPVVAGRATISVFVHVDAAYIGAWPLLEVLNLPGGGAPLQVVATSAALDPNYEELVCTFAPPKAGFVRVRLRSRDASTAGRCWFDNLTVVSGPAQPEYAPQPLALAPAAAVEHGAERGAERAEPSPHSGRTPAPTPAPAATRLGSVVGASHFAVRRLLAAGRYRVVLRCSLVPGFAGAPPAVRLSGPARLEWEARPPVTGGSSVYYELVAVLASDGELQVQVEGQGTRRQDVVWIEDLQVQQQA